MSAVAANGSASVAHQIAISAIVPATCQAAGESPAGGSMTRVTASAARPSASPMFCAPLLPPAAAIASPCRMAARQYKVARNRGYSRMQDTIVVAGGGHAAAQVVDSLRRDGFAGRLVMVCGEPSLPYQRPPLSKKFLGGELDVERLPIRHAAYYETIHCELMLGNPVVAIDAGARKLTLSDGGSLAYDKLVLAVGGHARPLPVPGSDLPGVHVLRTMADVQAIRAKIGPGVRVAIVGAGYIGLECAATFRKLGLDVTVIEMMDRVMNRVVAPQMSSFYQAEHAGHGVNVLTDRKVSAFWGDGSVHARRVHRRHAGARGPRDRRHRPRREHVARRSCGAQVRGRHRGRRALPHQRPGHLRDRRLLQPSEPALRAAHPPRVGGQRLRAGEERRREHLRQGSAARQDAVVLVRPVRAEAADRRAQPAL